MWRGQALAGTRAVQIHTGSAKVAALRHPSNTPRFTVIAVTFDLVVAADCVCLRAWSLAYFSPIVVLFLLSLGVVTPTHRFLMLVSVPSHRLPHV